MGALERVLQFLRPLVSNKTWDYCVVWKFGDDPSRFIEWVGCCCAGAFSEQTGNVKVEVPPELLPSCRDIYMEHSANTKACEALAHLPSSMPLYSGVHGEAVMSTEPTWHSTPKDSNTNQYEESTGTQVLIPVVGGLIELFSTKEVPKDQNMIDSIHSQYDIILKQEGTSSLGLLGIYPNEQSHDELFHGEFSYPDHTPKLQFMPNTINFRKALTDSNPSISSDSVHTCLPPKQELDTAQRLDCVAEEDRAQAKPKTAKQNYHSKNLLTERRRRHRIKHGLYTLRSLVPNITKMDRASIVGDAVDYIKDLLNEVKTLENELENMEEKNEMHIPELTQFKGEIHSTGRERPCCRANREKHMEVEVDVHQIGPRDFMLKVLCDQERGGFTRLMEAVTCLGLGVIHVNVTTLDGKVLSILTIEVNKTGVEAKVLRDSLIAQLTNPSEQ